MTKRKKEGGKTSAKIFSGIFFAVGLVVLVFIGVSLGKETYRKKQIQKEIGKLQTEIAKVGQENREMENLISYLSSPEFQEKEAREKLNLQKENERMIVLRKELNQRKENEEVNQDSKTALNEDNSPNWQKWLKFFFGKNQ